MTCACGVFVIRTFFVHLVAHVDMVCVVRDQARAPKTVHSFLHQTTLTNQRAAQLRQLTLKGRGSVSRPQRGLPQAEGERLHGENREQEVALDVEPGPPGI